MIIIMLGAPCSGKSTIGKTLAGIYKIPYISSGDIARKMGEENKDIGRDLISGMLAPEEFMRSAIKNSILGVNSYVLDGFPRFDDQYDWLFENAEFQSQPIFINVTCKYAELVSRSAGRNREDDISFKNRIQFFLTRTLPMIMRITNVKLRRVIEVENTNVSLDDAIEVAYRGIEEIINKEE